MKTIIENSTNCSKYLFADDKQVNVKADCIEVGDPANLDFIIGDLNATGQRDVLFEFHGYIVQQVHSQRNHRALSLRFRGSIYLFYKFYFTYKQKKKSRAHFM